MEGFHLEEKGHKKNGRDLKVHLISEAPFLGRSAQGVNFRPVDVLLLDNVGGGEQGDPLGDQVGEVDEGGAGGRRAREQEQLWSVVLHMFAHPEEQSEF